MLFEHELRLIASAFLLCLTTTVQAEVASEESAFLVLPGTQSPDGHYAVAWGLPKHPEIWAEACQFDREHPPEKETEENSKQGEEVFTRVTEVAVDVENYIVDLRDAKIIHTLVSPWTPGVSRDLEPDYYFAGGRRPNRNDLEVVWSRSGDLVLVNHTYRWDCVRFCAVSIFENRPGPELDLNKQLGDAVRIFVAKSSPDFSGSKSDLNVAFSDLKQGSDIRFSVHADAVMGKGWASDGAEIEFALAPSRKTMTAKVLAIHVSSGK